MRCSRKAMMSGTRPPWRCRTQPHSPTAPTSTPTRNATMTVIVASVLVRGAAAVAGSLADTIEVSCEGDVDAAVRRERVDRRRIGFDALVERHAEDGGEGDRGHRG